MSLITRLYRCLLILALNLTPTLPAWAQNQQDASQTLVIQSLKASDPQTQVQWLATDNPESEHSSFLALYKPASASAPIGCFLIVPDQGQSPDQAGWQQHLRRRAPEHGWCTMSIQPPAELEHPITELSANHPLNLRIQKGLAALEEKNQMPLVLVAIGTSASLTQSLVPFWQGANVMGMIVVEPVSASLEAFPLPRLTVLPQHYSRYNPNPAARLNPFDQQRIIPGSKAGFNGQERLLAKTIRGWATQLMKSY